MNNEFKGLKGYWVKGLRLRQACVPVWIWCKVTTFSRSAQIIRQLFSADFQSSVRYWAILSDIERFLYFTPKASPNPTSSSLLLLEQLAELHRIIFVHRNWTCVHKSTPVLSKSSSVDSIRYGVKCVEILTIIYSMHREKYSSHNIPLYPIYWISM